MYYMDDEDYFGPSEFDTKIEELKNELRESVKKEVKDELEKLRTENKKLQGIKENFESVKKDYERKKAECERVMRNAEAKAKQAGLKELMECVKVTLWSADWKYQFKKKCDMCNEYRKIKVTLPSGNVVDDVCKCGRFKKVYHTSERLLYALEDDCRKLTAWYTSARDGECFEAETYSADTIVNHNKDFKELEEKDSIHIFFTTKEECQKFCDYMNRKEENSGYDYDRAGKLIKAREV